MKLSLAVGLWLVLTASPLVAGPREDAIVALMRLADQPNYTWVTTVSDDARTYDIEGRTVRGSFTRVKMPVINTVRRRLGRAVTDTQIEFIFLGNVACVVESEHGWVKPDELPPPPEEADDYVPFGTPQNPITLGAPGSLSGGVIKGTVVRPRRPKPDEAQVRGYSNLQLAISHPHEDLGVIVGSHAEFHVEGDAVGGTLTDSGAQLLLVRDGQKQITPVRASGTFKVWFRDGLPVKYQLRLDGVLIVETPTSRRQVAVRQHSDTVIRDVGRTSFVVPDQAVVRLTR
jgi:hypothetical protein